MYWPLNTFEVKLRPATVMRVGACVKVYCSTPLRLLTLSGSRMSGPRLSSSPQAASPRAKAVAAQAPYSAKRKVWRRIDRALLVLKARCRRSAQQPRAGHIINTMDGSVGRSPARLGAALAPRHAPAPRPMLQLRRRQLQPQRGPFARGHDGDRLTGMSVHPHLAQNRASGQRLPLTRIPRQTHATLAATNFAGTGDAVAAAAGRGLVAGAQRRQRAPAARRHRLDAGQPRAHAGLRRAHDAATVAAAGAVGAACATVGTGPAAATVCIDCRSLPGLAAHAAAGTPGDRRRARRRQGRAVALRARRRWPTQHRRPAEDGSRRRRRQQWAVGEHADQRGQHRTERRHAAGGRRAAWHPRAV